MRNLILIAVLFVISNVASAAIVHEGTKGFSYTSKSSLQKIYVHVEKVTGNGFNYGVYSIDGTSFESAPLKEGWNTVYVPADVTKLGAWGYQGNSGSTVYSGTNVKQAAFDFSKTEIGTNKFVFANKSEVKGVVTIGRPLPTPVVTLLIALALGAGLVLYRSRKQQAEA